MPAARPPISAGARPPSTRAGLPALLSIILATLVGQGAIAAPAEGDQTRVGEQASEEAAARAAKGQTEAPRPRQRKQGDASKIPRMHSPTVHVRERESKAPVVGWSAELAQPQFEDHRRRLPATPLPNPYADSLKLGERFVFDVFFAGNPAGMAEAGVVEYRPDPRGEPPQGSGQIRIEGRAVTSGVVSLLASMEDTMTTWVDATTGTAISSVNVIDRSGLGTSKYKTRTTTTEFEGRGYIRVIDTKDDKTTKLTRHVPRDTFDPLSAMAWVRSLDLGDGDKAEAHVIDGKVLLKVEVIGRGQAKLDPMPSIATGLGVKPEDVRLLEGTLSWVDRYGVIREDQRTYTFRAYVTADERRLLLAIETDMWLGVIRLVLNRYDPPYENQPKPVAG